MNVLNAKMQLNVTMIWLWGMQGFWDFAWCIDDVSEYSVVIVSKTSLMVTFAYKSYIWVSEWMGDMQQNAIYKQMRWNDDP